MAYGFKWRMGDYVGGQRAVHQAYKPWLALDPEEWAIGEFSIAPRDTTDRVFTGLGFEPDVLFLITPRVQLSNGLNDREFGATGGGMAYGVAGRACPNIVQFSGASRIRWAFEQKYSGWREDCCLHVVSNDAGTEVLRLVLVDFDPDGFTLEQSINLYDQSMYVAWLAMKGRFKTQIISAGDTQINGVPGSPTAAFFMSTQHTLAHGPLRAGVWHHMQGFATQSSQASIWGGGRDPNWDFTTEHWRDADSITLALSALSSGYVGAELRVAGRITNWFDDEHSVTITRSGSTATVSDPGHGYGVGDCVYIAGATQINYNGVVHVTGTTLNTWDYEVPGTPTTPATGTITATVGGVDLQYPTFDGNPYRVGCVLMGEPADSGVLETNWETRPGGTQNDPPGSGTNWVPTAVRPRVVLMQATNYFFSTNNLDPFDLPRLPNTFGFGGSGGLGWHAQPFTYGAGDSFGIHVFGNAVAERGRYANSGGQYMRGYILAGQGANSNPPAYHQHSVDIIPSPRYVGLNYRFGERHAQIKRFHRNESDVYVP